MELKCVLGFVLLGAILVFEATPAEAIECYSCMGKGCGDEFDPNAMGVTKETCSGSCAKSKSKLGVARKCSILPAGEDICEEKDDVHMCLCTSDLCNTGMQVQVSMTTALVMLSVYLLTRFF